MRRIHVHSAHSEYLRIIKLLASSGLCLWCHIHNLHHGERDDNVAICSSSCHVFEKLQVSDCILVQARPEHDVQD